MKTQLKNIDLISIDTLNVYETVKALNYCKKFFDFGETILLTHCEQKFDGITSIKIDKCSYEKINLYMFHYGKYIKNDFALCIHNDGHIINPNLWTNEFLNYDYIGAPWPNPEIWPEFESIKTYLLRNNVGNGGFSLRSRKFLDYCLSFQSTEGWSEDMYLSLCKYEDAIKYGIKFAPTQLAYQFSMEIPPDWNNKKLYELDKSKHFGWHGKSYFSNSADLLKIKNEYQQFF
jgi:hypothetical protein